MGFQCLGAERSGVEMPCRGKSALYAATHASVHCHVARNQHLNLSSVCAGLDPRETRTAQGAKLVAAMLPENCGGNAVYISASDRHSCVVTDTGDLFTWGTAGEGVGALGHGDRNWQPVAKRVTSLKKVTPPQQER